MVAPLAPAGSALGFRSLGHQRAQPSRFACVPAEVGLWQAAHGSYGAPDAPGIYAGVMGVCLHRWRSLATLTGSAHLDTSVSLATPFMSACGMASRASQIAPRVAIFASAEARGPCRPPPRR